MYLILIASLSIIIMKQQIYMFNVTCNSIYDSFDCKYIIIKNNKVQLKIYS